MQEVMGTYTQFKKALDTELAKTAEGFVRIGYLLKVARDTEVLSESGYSSVAEFAKAEYGLSKDIVSRYIHINDKYSKDGYDEELADQYKGFGYSKLAEMLTLPDEIADALDPKMTRQQIQEVKKEVKQEEEITPLEVLTEETKQKEYNNDLSLFLYQYGHEVRENYSKLAKAAVSENFVEQALNVIAPSGVAMLTIRIAGRGRLMLSIRGKDNELQLLDVRDSSKNANFTWQQLQVAIIEVYKDGTEETWEETYKEPFKTEETTNQVKQDVGDIQGGVEPQEKEPEVAPVQPKLITDNDMTDEEVGYLCEIVDGIIRKYKKELKTLSEFTIQKVSELYDNENLGGWIEIEVSGNKYIADDTNINVEVFADDRNEKGCLSSNPPILAFAPGIIKEELTKVLKEEPELLNDQIPGQAVIEDYPETLPESIKQEIVETEDAVERGYKAAVTNNLRTMIRLWESTDENKIKIMLEKIEDLKWRLEKLQKIEEK